MTACNGLAATDCNHNVAGCGSHSSVALDPSTAAPCGRSSETNNHRPRAGKALPATHGQPEGPDFPESGDSPGFLVNLLTSHTTPTI